MVWVELVAGLALLLVGGEGLVRGSVGVAARMGVSPLLIGLTLVGFGTSTPELVASVDAALIGAPGIAVGNIVGSNVANILLILGLSALIAPIATAKEAFRRDGAMLAVSALMMLAVVLAGVIGRGIGLAFIAVLLGYVLYTYATERRTHDASAALHEAEAEEVTHREMPLWLGVAFTVGGIAAVVLGADLLVGSAVVLARELGMTETVIGLTLVAIGTSLPELATSILAAFRRHGDVAFGNIVGSNIFNVLGIAGVTAVVTPIPIPGEIVRLDIWVMLAVTALLIVFAVTGWRLSRREGGLLLAGYAAYLVVQLSPGLRGALGLA